MLTKDQAAAMADAMTAPAEAKRQQHIDARDARRWAWLPELRDVPAENRVAALGAAQNYAVRCWIMYAPLALALAWALYPLYAVKLLGLPPIAKHHVAATGLAMGATALIQRYLTRSHVKRALRQNRQAHIDHEPPTDA